MCGTRQWILSALNDLRVKRTSGASFASFSKKWEGEQKAGVLIYHKVQFLECMVERVKNGDNRSIYWGKQRIQVNRRWNVGYVGYSILPESGGLRSSSFTSSMRGFMEGEIKSLLPVATWW